MVIFGPYGSQRRVLLTPFVLEKLLGARIRRNLSGYSKRLTTSGNHFSRGPLWSNLGGTPNSSTKCYPYMKPIEKRQSIGLNGVAATVMARRVIKILPMAVLVGKGNLNAGRGKAYG